MQFIKSFFFIFLVYTTFETCSSSTIVFHVTGNVYPNMMYHVTLNIGDPPKPYFLLMDSGSTLTWIQCDLSCEGTCLPAPHPPHKRDTAGLLSCRDPRCASLQWPKLHQCPTPEHQCDYKATYVNSITSTGVLVEDWFSLKYINGTVTKTRLAFGCGYHQQYPQIVRPYIDGVLGLGLGDEGMLSQMQQFGVTFNIVGHCLSLHGDGYMFFGGGEQLIPSDIVWFPRITTDISLRKKYYLGTAELAFGGLRRRVKGLRIVFDCGSPFTYFIPKAYNALVSQLENDLKGNEQISEDDYPICWKGERPFESIEDVKVLFKTITLIFKDSWLQWGPENYIFITEHGNACLGIFNSSDVGLPRLNLIGAISFLDQIIVYDNVHQRIGWYPASCELPLDLNM